MDIFFFATQIDHDRLRMILKGVQLIILKIAKQKESLKHKKEWFLKEWLSKLGQSS